MRFGLSLSVAGIFVLGSILQSSVTNRPVSTQVKRALEQEIVFRGRAYMNAIKSYYLADSENPSFPRSISDLISDQRLSGRRHLRREYENPLGGGWRSGGRRRFAPR